MNPIFIPSKGRAKTSKLIQQINEHNLEHKFFIEPQEYSDYKKIISKKNLINIESKNKGIAFVRQFILDYAIKNKIYRYWQLDDDITGFYYRVKNKMIKKNILVLEKVEKQFSQQDYGVFALEYRQFAWSANKDIIENSYMDTCINVDANKAKEKNIKYRPLAFKSDRDFGMQFIYHGCKIGRSTLYAFSCPQNGSNKGGLYDEYNYKKGAKEKQAVEQLIKYWGSEIVKPITKKDGRNDAKIYWKKINNKQETLF
tara:strand:+ start:508 stop:1275 length:768 start_codon:yes stop_codon:yes gene_type:complete